MPRTWAPAPARWPRWPSSWFMGLRCAQGFPAELGALRAILEGRRRRGHPSKACSLVGCRSQVAEMGRQASLGGGAAAVPA